MDKREQSVIHIRPVEPADVPAWSAMRAALWPDAEAGDLRREAGAFAAGERVTTLDAAFVADDHGRAIGFVELSIRPFADGCESMPVPFVEAWYVDSAMRGRGVGRALMAAAEDWARVRGYGELGSDALAENEASHRAHRACGFEETERIVMFRKRVSAARLGRC